MLIDETPVGTVHEQPPVWKIVTTVDVPFAPTYVEHVARAPAEVAPSAMTSPAAMRAIGSKKETALFAASTTRLPLNNRNNSPFNFQPRDHRG
jgi:hypothetical protein